MLARAGALAREIGGADCLMRFLCILCFGCVVARLVGDVAGIEARRDRAAGGGDRLLGHLHAIGAHVSDRAFLVEMLGEAHRLAGRKAELARGLLLPGRARARGRRPGGAKRSGRARPPWRPAAYATALATACGRRDKPARAAPGRRRSDPHRARADWPSPRAPQTW